MYSLASFGFVLPLFGTLLLVEAINVATVASPAYRPSLNPSIPMALLGNAAAAAAPVRIMLLAITAFGAARFGAKVLHEFPSIRSIRSQSGRLSVMAGFIGCILWVSMHQFSLPVQRLSDFSTLVLVVSAAVLTANFVARGGSPRGPVQSFNWIGVTALLAGVTTPYHLQYWLDTDVNAWWRPWLVPAYGAGFAVYVIGLAVQSRILRRRSQ